jgi:nucleoside-diphosphate-sugar epimerase
MKTPGMEITPRVEVVLNVDRFGQEREKIKMRILVTGARGLLGSEVVKQGKSRGHTILELDIAINQSHDLTDGDNSDWLYKNKFDKDIDAVIHLAAHPHPRPHVSWREYLELNTLGMINVADNCVAAKIPRLVCASSVAVYGFDPALKTKPQKFPVPEIHPYLTQNCDNALGDVSKMIRDGREQDARDFICYSMSKVMAEQAMVYYGSCTPLSIIMLRLTTMGHNGGGGLRPDWMWLDLDVKNAAQAFLNAAETQEDIGYMVANVTNEPIYPEVEIEKWVDREYPGADNQLQPCWAALDLTRAHDVLGYRPEPRPDYDRHVENWEKKK